MAYATTGQINDRLYDIDDLLFKISTGQVSATIEEQQQLTSEADWIMDTIAKVVSEGGEYDYQTAWNERDKVRRAKHFAAMTARFVELHPEPNPEHDRIIARACADDASAEDREALVQMYSEIFVEQAPVPPPKVHRSLFSRLFSRR